MLQELVTLLSTVREKFTDESDMVWTRYTSPEDVRIELNAYLDQLRNSDTSCLDSLNSHFAPTSTFQEHSIQNGWADEYLELAKAFDTIYLSMEKPILGLNTRTSDYCHNFV
jgi:hypothetical protein